MPPHDEYFWAAGLLVAALAVFLLLRLFPKRINLSGAERARRDDGRRPRHERQARPKPPPEKKN
jgi:hypothetical protein